MSSITTVSQDNEQRSRMMSTKFRRWFFEGIKQQQKSRDSKLHQAAWWKVMCLTGVDYFSTLGYQPGIAFLAAGALSPFATLTIVLLTLFGALPVYSRVAKESPHGQGSIAMLENLFPGWRGKTIVLILLGFAATDFIITITLSAADATAHVVENPLVIQQVPPWLLSREGITLFLLSVLGAIFLLGFREAIGVSIVLVILYLTMSGIIIGVAGNDILEHPEHIQNWQQGLMHQYKSFWTMAGISLILFPKLALGMSGFETGVAVMPLVKGRPDDDPEQPDGRVRNTRKLLFTAALLMSVFLIGSAITTTLLIEPAKFADNGEANGRALAYLAHEYLGHGFGTAYDISSILILWFAGASAMAGLLNLVPRYLPRYGMAPDWAGAMRPLVVFFTLVSFVVTLIFRADVDAQAGAYATGVLVLITSAAVAVTISAARKMSLMTIAYLVITLVFTYTTILNMIERPEGLHIASFFIGAILVTSLISRAIRSLELRVSDIKLDSVAEKFIATAASRGEIRILSHRPGGTDYCTKEAESREVHSIQHPEGDFIFLEVNLSDASDFSDELHVKGVEVDGYQVLRCTSPAIPNAIAALLLHIRDKTGKIPHAYFGWTEGNPLTYIFKFIFLGEGETAPVCREVLRITEPVPKRRPKIHVG